MENRPIIIDGLAIHSRIKRNGHRTGARCVLYNGYKGVGWNGGLNKFFAITGQLVYDFPSIYVDETIFKPTKNTLPAGA